MCGIAGIYNLQPGTPVPIEILRKMTEVIFHRGPDEFSHTVFPNAGLGFRRLSIRDLGGGQQPFRHEQSDVTLICNGEIYNHRELRKELAQKGFTFRSDCDVEVILPLYLEYGTEGFSRLNGQFAFAIFDGRDQSLILARDHFGICPLFYGKIEDQLIFGSEAKCLLEHPSVSREVNLRGLDQTFSFPGMVSPTTIFEGIQSLKPGHFLKASGGQFSIHEYWDLTYPVANENLDSIDESSVQEQFESLLIASVSKKLDADVPVGFYLSGGLDSSLVGALIGHLRPKDQFDSFSIVFPELKDATINEQKYQRLMAKTLGSRHHEIPFGWSEIEASLRDVIYHSECPLKETYNTCSLALSGAVNESGVKVVLSGEGADELLGGYVGYRFDQNQRLIEHEGELTQLLEQQTREVLWGDQDFFYEKNQYEFHQTLEHLYSENVRANLGAFSAISSSPVNVEQIIGRDKFHQRSYVDLKLRLSDHLIADHCDRVAYANSVEGRYPFLDTDLVQYLTQIPASVKLKGLEEKYLLKQVARKYLPSEIIERQKFGFVAPDSSSLLQNKVEWVWDLLSYDQVARQGYFDPNVVERLKERYAEPGFRLNVPYEDDLLIVVLTFNMVLEVFGLSDYTGIPQEQTADFAEEFSDFLI